MFKVTLAVLLFVSVSSVFGQCGSGGYSSGGSGSGNGGYRSGGCGGGGTRVIYQPQTQSTQTRYYDSQPVYQQRYSSPVYQQTEYVSQPMVYETRRVISQPSYSSQSYYSNPQPVYREEYSSPVVYRQSNPVRYETSGTSSGCRSCQSY